MIQQTSQTCHLTQNHHHHHLFEYTGGYKRYT